MRRVIIVALTYWVSSLQGCVRKLPQGSKRVIKRVENGLTNTVLLKGKAVEHYSVAQRIEHFHVRGLSVAAGLPDLVFTNAADGKVEMVVRVFISHVTVSPENWRPSDAS
jgi:hypothetical protein